MSLLRKRSPAVGIPPFVFRWSSFGSCFLSAMAAAFTTGNPKITAQEAVTSVDDLSLFAEGRDRTKHLFNNELLSDAVFLVGKNEENPGTRTPVHTYPLQGASPVFMTMFSETWKKDEPIEITDFQPSAVYSLLRWVYGQELVFEEGMLADVLRIANKYLVMPLIHYVEDNVKKYQRYVWSVLSFAEETGSKSLQEMCLATIAAEPDRFCDMDDFLNAPASFIRSIVSLPFLSIDELKLFKRCLKWSEAKCARRGLDVNPVNQRSAMDPFIHLFAFPAMSPEEFGGSPRQSGVLTPDEESEILKFQIRKRQRTECSFRTVARKVNHLCEFWSAGAMSVMCCCEKCFRRMCLSCYNKTPAGHGHEFDTSKGRNEILSQDLCEGSILYCPN